MIQHGDEYDATHLPNTISEDASILDETPMLSTLDDRSMWSKDPSSTVPRKRGRPKRQIPAIETDHLEIEPKRRLRSRISSITVAADDPWVILSNSPLITSSSPKKPHKVAPMQKLVNDPSFCPCNCTF